MISITELVDDLALHLANSFAHEGLGFKENEDSKTGEWTTKPRIFKYCLPTSAQDVSNGYPLPKVNPCIVIALEPDMMDNTYHCYLALCVVNPSISEEEKAIPVGNNLYEFEASDEYTTDSDHALYTMSLLFTERVYASMKMYTRYPLSELKVTMPTPDLPQSPYAVSYVHFTAKLNPFNVGQNHYADLL